ncbi:Rieske (2Fe-2S) protein [Streptomyces somaliensis]|uniref:Rieske (2Fe-2S) protein n=1 Tax=Streptomyces somaliensis TaxID=78355 RepID=UPI0020CBFC2D|nr:Rieske (2Fe-2S) protein [Streptomyces somaliensis]MCP9946238.1 Rieske (2Fe-2S) protein [Streptomyces somaliensis]MCP9960607.1 Rieske (2Fe-2S) protein [Streptomyces somaliensis]MCP9973385.1 Rieske (2Fe-2S) protein [Streptomyces somaliensis]
MSGQSATRRTVLKGAALAGTAGFGAAACSTESKLGRARTPTPTAPVDLGPAAEVPVGGARLYREQRLLVHRPAHDEYRVFSAQCTHAGCPLDRIEEDEGNCPCHGSRFDVTTGEVLKGPATVPLPAVPVTVRNGRLVAGPQD